MVPWRDMWVQNVSFQVFGVRIGLTIGCRCAASGGCMFHEEERKFLGILFSIDDVTRIELLRKKRCDNGAQKKLMS